MVVFPSLQGSCGYGLLDRMLRDDIALRTLLRERGRYISDVDSQSAFIGRALRSISLVWEPTVAVVLSWFSRAYGSAQPTYIANIHQTFVGVAQPMFGEVRLKSAQDVREHGFPLPIFGASVSVGPGQPLDGYPYRYEHFFELSPLRSGAPVIGYFDHFGEQLTLGQAVAVSAAAIDIPRGELQLPEFLKVMNIGLGGNFIARRADGSAVQFYLADGGFIENLGLLPLLRRGCTQILAFDNSEDHGDPFATWNSFAEQLAAQQRDWRIIHPLRAANADPLPARKNNDAARWALPHHIWDAQLQNAVGTKVHVRLVKLGMRRQAMDLYPASVRKFAEKNWRGKAPGCFDALLGQRCSFPLESTLRQSFKKDEFRAYRHLGAWLAEQALTTAPPTFEPTDAQEASP